MYSDKQILEELKIASDGLNVSAHELFRLLKSEIGQIRWVSKQNLYAEILLCYSWEKVQLIIPPEKLPEVLSMEVIRILFPRSLRDKYLPIRESLLSSKHFIDNHKNGTV